MSLHNDDNDMLRALLFNKNFQTSPSQPPALQKLC